MQDPGTFPRAALELHAVTPGGPLPLPVRPEVRSAHELLDGLPLGVYSALRTFEHQRFLGLELHLDRTDRSMELLGWSERLDRASLRLALHRTASAYPAPDSFVRFDVLAEAPAALGIPYRTLLALSPHLPVPGSYLLQGVSVHFSSLRRSRPLIKTASFVLERRPHPLGLQEAYESLLVDERGRILEGTSSNFLAIEGRTLRVAGDEALQGITQRFVMELASGMGLEVLRDPVHRDELPGLEEAFLTSSSRGIVPVVSIEEREVGEGRPGPWTRRLLEAYPGMARARARPALEETSGRA